MLLDLQADLEGNNEGKNEEHNLVAGVPPSILRL